MRTKENKVYLNEEERSLLKKLTSYGTASATIIKRANILLSFDENNGKVKTQEKIAEIYGCNPALLHMVARQYAEG